MVNKHDQSGLLGVLSQDQVTQFFSDTVTIIRKLAALDAVWENFETGELDDDDVFEYLEGFRINITQICIMADCMISTNAALNRYLSQTSNILKIVSGNIETIVDYSMEPDLETSKKIRKELSETIGGLVYYLVYEFSLTETFEKSGQKDYPIDEIFYDYIRMYSVDISGFKQEIVHLQEKYKYKLDFFDEHAELEPVFAKAVGPWYNLIPTANLTMQIVMELINGEYSAEEFVNRVNPDERFSVE